MITRRIEVKDARGNRGRGIKRYSLAGLLFSLPWCCITPLAFSLLGFLGAAGTTGDFLIEFLYPIFAISILLLGRANYLSFYKKQGSMISRALVLIFTAIALSLWAFRFGLITI